MRPIPEGIVKEKFPNTKKPSHQQIFGEFWNLRGQRKWEEKQKTQNTRLTTTLSGEVAQTLASATSEQGLTMEVQVACLG